jgi:hypothetical protein
VAVAGTGAILAALVPSPFETAVAATPVLENTVTLPTVVVRPEPVTLATITVRGDDLLRGDQRIAFHSRPCSRDGPARGWHHRARQRDRTWFGDALLLLRQADARL